MKYDQLQPLLRQSSDPVINTIGKYGCYLLCLFQIGNVFLPSYDFENGLQAAYHKYVKHRWIDGDCTIFNGPAILNDLTGDRWDIEKIDRPMLPKASLRPNTEIIYCYRAFSGDGYHFKTAYCDTEIERDRLLAGFRIYTRMG
jgi:hypothetical protein